MLKYNKEESGDGGPTALSSVQDKDSFFFPFFLPFTPYFIIISSNIVFFSYPISVLLSNIYYIVYILWIV